MFLCGFLYPGLAHHRLHNELLFGTNYRLLGSLRTGERCVFQPTVVMHNLRFYMVSLCKTVQAKTIVPSDREENRGKGTFRTLLSFSPEGLTVMGVDAGVDPGPAVSRDSDLDQSKPTLLTSQDPAGGVLGSSAWGSLQFCCAVFFPMP